MKLLLLILLVLGISPDGFTAYCSFEQKCRTDSSNFFSDIFSKIGNEDDPGLYPIDEYEYTPEFSKTLYWVSPSEQLSKKLRLGVSNNNVAIEFYSHRLFVAFRNSDSHFASEQTRVYIVSTEDGKNWDVELELGANKDIREPLLAVMNGKLHFYYFEAGINPFAFEPGHSFVQVREGPGIWSTKSKIGLKGEVFWSIKKRGNALYSTSYVGNHYEIFNSSNIDLNFRKSSNGKNFEMVGNGPVYNGGVSETAFEFDADGSLWAITRNEDGDSTGFGSHLIKIKGDNISKWNFPSKSNPRIFMSPKMFNHNGDIYLVARRNLNSVPFDTAATYLPDFARRLINWGEFSTSAKTTALFKVDKQNTTLLHLMDLPGTGDTAFPSIKRLDKDNFLIANYTSSLNKKYRWWIRGQLGETGIYLIKLSFIPKGDISLNDKSFD